MAKGWTVVILIMILDVDVTAEGGPPALGAKGCVERLHPTGETTHYDLCVAGAPASSAVTDSLDFQVADAPLQIQFA